MHRAARICAAAHGGQILVSNATAGIIEDLEPAEFDLRELGEFRLKDIAKPQRLFQLVVQGLEREFAPPMTLDAASDPYGRVGTLLATDIRGWSRFLRVHGDDAAGDAGDDYRRIVQETVAAHEGVTLEAVADWVLAVFDRPRDAVDCAVAARERLREHIWPPGFECPTAFAVHTGRLVSKNHKRHFGPPYRGACERAGAWADSRLTLDRGAPRRRATRPLAASRSRRTPARRALSTPYRVFELVGDGSG